LLIEVMYQNNEYGKVNPFLLDKMIASGKIKKFLRSEKWATIGIDPIRGTGGHYKGPERRIELLKDEDKTKEQLIHELKELRQQISEFDISESQLEKAKDLLRTTESKQAEETPQESEERYRKMYEEATDAIFLADFETGMLLDCNIAASKLIEREKSEIIGKHQSFLHPVDNIKDGFSESFKSHIVGESSELLEDRVITKSGQLKDVAIRASKITIKGKKVLQGIFRDVTDRKQAEKRIAESLREKETLLRELYHRTRNNMQVISNLIDLQALSINDKKIVELFKETQSRIKSMALVHEKLYQSKDLSNVNLKDYINELVNTLLTSYQISRDTIVLKLDIDNISVSIDAAIPSGLIVNELMSNSLKYAFPGDRQGEISIMLHKNEKGEIELYFSDNGIGFPKGFDINNPKSLGLKLVKNLTEKQLEGKVELRTNQRTEFLIKFKEPQYLKSL
jgi:PAS domain S-box-containing protein